MNKRFIGVLTFAFVVALGASLILYRVMLSKPGSTKAAAPTVGVVLASKDLESGTVLKEEDVKLTDWAGPVPVGAATQVQELVGRDVITPIYAKEPVLESRLAPKGAGGGLSAMIPKGMRAVAIRVNEVVGVAGFVVAGMRVDILISGNAPGANAQLGTVTKTMLQDIEVLSAGQDFKKDAEGKPIAVQVINLLVTPEQAEQLSLASSQTSIQLVLRNRLDRDVTKTPGTAVANLFSGFKGIAIARPPVAAEGQIAPRRARRDTAPPVPIREFIAAPPKKESFTMEIISGSAKSEKKFDNNPEVK